MKFHKTSTFRLLILITFGFYHIPSYSQDFNQFIIHISSLPENQRQAVADSFLTVNQTAPFIEYDTACHFYDIGNWQTVAIAGDFNLWNPTTHLLTRIAGTNFWYLSYIFPSDTRTDYKIVRNGTNWIIDPRNPYTSLGGFGANSELRMPMYVRPIAVDYIQQIPHGTFKDTVFSSSFLGNSRNIKVYMPAGYSSGQQNYPVVYFHDGLEYVSLAKANNTLDYLIHNNIIRPVIGVFVPPVNRTDEYAGVLQDEFTNFFINELVPWVDSRFKTINEPGARAVIGASNGGNIALWLMASHPETFLKVAAHSSNVEPNITTAFQQLPTEGKQIYIDIGKFDIEILIERVNALKQLLAEKNFNFAFLPVNDGHSWANWRDHLINALTYLFPVSQGINNPQKGKELFGRIRPNPVKDKIFIEIDSDCNKEVIIQLFDANGREIHTHWITESRDSKKIFTADISQYKTGLYLVAFNNGMGSGSQRFIKN